MKKLIKISLLFLSTFSLVGCENGKVKLTFGNKMKVDDFFINSFCKIQTGNLIEKLESNEVFLLATTSSEECTCWTSTISMLVNLYNRYSLHIYTYVGNEIDEITKHKVFVTSNPTLYLINKGSVRLKIDSNSNKDAFNDADKMFKLIENHIRLPNMYYIDEAYLTSNIFSGKEKSVITYIKYDCPDCTYCIPNVLVPFFKEKEYKDNLYLFDIKIASIGLNDEQYLQKKRTWKLTDQDENGNINPFGYDDGYVPTSQYWENGKLISMNVYFNDVIEKQNDNYVVSKSYFSKDRIKLLSYETQILEGLVLKEEEVGIYDEKPFWKQNFSSKYHNFLLKSFLTTYIN